FTLLRGEDGKALFATTVDAARARVLLDYDFVQGSFADLTANGMLVSTGEAKRKHLQIGSTVTVHIGDVTKAVTIEGIYSTNDIAQARVVDRALLDGTSAANQAGFVVLTRAPGVSDAQLRRAVNAAIRDYGIGTLQDREQFINGRSAIIDRSLAF